MKYALVFTVALCLSGSLFTRNYVNADKALTYQMYDLPLEIEEELFAEIKFYVDNKNRLQVLTVTTDDPYVRKLL